ncbi:glycosyltransferase [Labilibacter sediminis]|nr:glycosyltransferase [Labilibacter sediminis]
MENKSGKSQIQVSLFLTTYNWPEALAACLNSIFQQKVLPNEIIIADDGSSDETRSLIKSFQQKAPIPTKHVWQEDIGFRLNAIRNKAIKTASYPYIIQIDGDMILDRHFVQDHVSHAKKGRALLGKRIELSEELTAKICSNFNENHSLKSVRNRFLGWLRHMVIYGSKTAKGVNGCNMSYWKSDALKVNGYDEDMQSKGPDDKDFASRLIHSGVKSYYLKFAGNAHHLKHDEDGRRPDYESIKEIYRHTLQTKKVRCLNGIQKISE